MWVTWVRWCNKRWEEFWKREEAGEMVGNGEEMWVEMWMRGWGGN